MAWLSVLICWSCVIYRVVAVVDARHYVAPGADRPPAAARALAEYIQKNLDFAITCFTDTRDFIIKYAKPVFFL
jgi:hypothetical protein